MNSIRIAAGGMNLPRLNLSAWADFASGRCIPAWIAVALLAAAAVGAARAQPPASPRGVISGGGPGVGTMPLEPGPVGFTPSESTASLTPLEQRNLWKRFNADRQRSMVSDVDRLLLLAGELKAELGEEGRISTPAEEMRRVKEIQRLAREVKDNMSAAEMPR
jgi:hypothetical protein